MENRTGVLIHGLHLQTQGWEEIVWGRPPHLLGILPQGAAIALREKASIVVFGTGASERNGKKEAEVARDLLLDRFLDLAQFTDFQGVDLEESRRVVQRISVVETHSQNTAQEVKFAGRMFQEAGVDRIFLVSSPTHISRCVRDAFMAFNEDGALRHFTYNLFASPSQMCFLGTTAQDVAIVEPSHRPDRTASNLNLLVQKMLRVPSGNQEEFLAQIEKLLAQYVP